MNSFLIHIFIILTMSIYTDKHYISIKANASQCHLIVQKVKEL